MILVRRGAISFALNIIYVLVRWPPHYTPNKCRVHGHRNQYSLFNYIKFLIIPSYCIQSEKEREANTFFSSLPAFFSFPYKQNLLNSMFSTESYITLPLSYFSFFVYKTSWNVKPSLSKDSIFFNIQINIHNKKKILIIIIIIPLNNVWKWVEKMKKEFNELVHTKYTHILNV